MENATLRIRKCTGNTDAWLLIRLGADGSERHTYGSYTTALSLDSLIANAGHLKPKRGQLVDIAA